MAILASDQSMCRMSTFMRWQVASVYDLCVCIVCLCVCVYILSYCRKILLGANFMNFVDRPAFRKITNYSVPGQVSQLSKSSLKACCSSKTVCYAHHLLLVICLKQFFYIYGTRETRQVHGDF